MSVASALGSVASGLLGKSGSKSKQQTTQTQQIDPAMRAILFGDGASNPGVFGTAQNLYNQNPSGMNPAMEHGINMQRQALMSPQYAQTFQNMRDNGNGLMNQGVASNPFTQQRGLGGAFGGMLAQSMGAQRPQSKPGWFEGYTTEMPKPWLLPTDGHQNQPLGGYPQEVTKPLYRNLVGGGYDGLPPELMVNGGMPRQAAPAPAPAPVAQAQGEQIPPDLLAWWREQQANKAYADRNA
jgi:hypothetical protein